MEAIRVGISGWRYPPWRGSFYPSKLTQKNELEFASQALRTLEINGSFYSLQRPSSYANWYAATPKDFIFSLKGPRFITHIKKLNDVETPLANFFASGVLLLKEKLGPILWQFPPIVKFDADKFENFLKLLPSSYNDARRLAKKHDSHLKGKVQIPAPRAQKLRHSMEIRNPSFACEEFITLLRKYNVAVVVADTAGRWPKLYDVTADFVYVRLHGEVELYASGYDKVSLKRWSNIIKKWSSGNSTPTQTLLTKPAKKLKHRDVFVYFDNDVKVFAPFNAHALASLLKVASSKWRELDLADKPAKLPSKRKRLGPRASGRLFPSAEDKRWKKSKTKK